MLDMNVGVPAVLWSWEASEVVTPSPCSRALVPPVAAAVAVLLMARTSLDVVMVNLTTRVERSIVGRDKAGFMGGLSRFAQLCVPVALVNSVRTPSRCPIQARLGTVCRCWSRARGEITPFHVMRV